MTLFLKDKNKTYSWDKIIEDVNNARQYNPYCLSEDLYSVLLNIIISMVFEKEIILLDSDFSDSEIQKLVGQIDRENYNIELDNSKINIKDKDQLISILRFTNDKWSISLFTSGTTGLPKKINHNFNSITRFVKYTEVIEKAIWGFAYNPTHMAGLQVFFQALLNGNTIVNLFQFSKDDILKEIKTIGVTHISATPTFYRLLLPIKKQYKTVVRITSGGEKFYDNIRSQLEEAFPNARITNVYASTEAGSLFASENDIFSVKPTFKELVKIQDNELFIHKSLLGQSETAISNWYNTNDLVEVISENPLKFKFISRKNEMINVGGSKVNPNEVEEKIQLIPGIINARVYGKPNSVLGNILCCEIVCNDNEIKESDIRKFLSTQLQEFKIPRIFKFLREIETTRTGKKKRI